MQMNQPHQEEARESRVRMNILKALAAIGFVIILVFGVWGVIQVARMVPSIASYLSAAAVSLTSIFTPAERLEITIPSAQVTSGDVFTLSWSHEGKRADGTYTVSFECRDGVSMEAPDQHGVYQKVFCNTPFNLTNETASMRLIPLSSTARFVDVGIKLAFTRLSDGKVTAETQTALTIVNEKAGQETVTPPAPTTPAPGTPTVTPTKPRVGTPTRSVYTVVPGGRISDPNGRVDLVVTIKEIGVINPTTNVFTPTTVVRRFERPAVRFVVENAGTKTVDNWSFNAVLPTMPMHIFHSDMQPTLGPGDQMEYTLGFDMPDQSTTAGVLTVNADPSNRIYNEISENNNIAKVVFTITN